MNALVHRQLCYTLFAALLVVKFFFILGLTFYLQTLLIKPNDEIYSFDFRFDKIFIKKAGSDERDIVGVATLKNGVATNEFYRVYEVKPCTPMDFGLYIATFKETYTSGKINMNIYAMDGTMIFIKEEPAKEPEVSSESVDSTEK